VARPDPATAIRTGPDPVATVKAEPDPATVTAALDPVATVKAEANPAKNVTAALDPIATVKAEPDPAKTVMAGLDPAIRSERHMRGGWVYIITNRPDGTLYFGVTSDLARRVAEHKDRVGSVFIARYGLKIRVWAEHHGEIQLAIQRPQALAVQLDGGPDHAVKPRVGRLCAIWSPLTFRVMGVVPLARQRAACARHTVPVGGRWPGQARS
jgi:putative endonuclease